MRDIDAARVLADATAAKNRAHAREVAACDAAKARGLDIKGILGDPVVRAAVREYQKVFAAFVDAEIALDPPSLRPKRREDDLPF